MRYLWGLGSILPAILAAYWPMLRHGYPYTHSIGSNALWAYQFGQQFLAGQLYPRWLEHSFASLGSPTFVFYPPVSMWAVVPFAALGWGVPQQLIGSVALVLATTALGAYLFSRSLFPDAQPGCRWLRGVCTASALLSPYFLLNIHVRGAIGEMWAMGWLTWIFWGAHLRLAGDQPWRFVPLTLAILLLALSHLPTLLLFAVVWMFLPVLFLQRGQPLLPQLLKSVWKLHLPFVFGLALASFFLLPPLLEKHLVNMAFIQIATPSQRLLVDGLLDFSPELTRHDFDRRLLLPFALTACTALAAVVVQAFTQSLHPWRHQARILCFGTLLSTLMMTDLGRMVYAWAEPLNKIQFSWRWLAVSSVCWPFLVGLLLAAAGNLTRRPWPRLALRFVTAASLAGLLTCTTRQVWQSVVPWPEKAAQLTAFFRDRAPFPVEATLEARPYHTVDFALLRTRLGEPFMTDVSEYTPVGIPGPPHLPQRSYPLVEWSGGGGEIDVVAWRYGLRRLLVTAREPGSIVLRTHVWPGWRVRVDGRLAHPVNRPDGRIQIPLQSGRHRVHVRYVGTPAERWGRRISGVTLLLLVGFFASRGRRLSFSSSRRAAPSQ